MIQGWVAIHKKMLENPVVFKDADHVAVWMYLLLNAAYSEREAMFKGKKIMLRPGQLITGRKTIAEFLKLDENKVKRVLINFENDQQIDRQRSNKNSLISLINWDKYQACDQQKAQPVTSGEIENAKKVTTYITNNNTINNNLSCASDAAQESIEEEKPPLPADKKTASQQDTEDFEKIYAAYPKKRGKAKAFEYYRGYVGRGRGINGIHYHLDRRQIYLAVAAYVQEKEEAGTELAFYQDFSTFMNKTILDYLPEGDST